MQRQAGGQSGEIAKKMHERRDAMLKRAIQGVVAAALVTIAATPALAQKNVRIASHVSETSPVYETADMFSERIKAEFPERFAFRFYPNGQLAKEKAQIDNVTLV